MSIVAEHPANVTVSTLRADLLEARLEKDEQGGWTRIPCDLRKVDLGELASKSAYLCSSNRIITDLPGRTKHVDLMVGEPWITDGELARVYLDWCLEAAQPKRKPKKRWVGYRHDDLAYLELGPPIHYGSPILEPRRLVLVDLDAAYWAIACLATLDLSFGLRPGGGIDVGYGKIGWHRPGEVCQLGGLSKRGRQAVIGYLHRREIEYYHYGELRHEPAPKRFTAPGLWGWMMCVLHAVAWEAVENWGCYRVATDSFLIDEADCEAFIGWLAEVWLLSGSVRARGMGRLYQLHWLEIRATKPGDISRSTKPVSDWWQNSFRDPPATWERSSNVVSRFPETRAALAASRYWLASR